MQMTWNYRVVRYKDDSEDGGYFYKICEVYYFEDNDLPTACCEADIGGCSIDDIKESIEHIQVALEKPILDESVFKKDIAPQGE